MQYLDNFSAIVSGTRNGTLNRRTGADLWSGDGLELFIGSEAIGEGGPLRFSDRQILIGAGKPDGEGQFHIVNAASQPDVDMAVKVCSLPGMCTSWMRICRPTSTRFRKIACWRSSSRRFRIVACWV